ncbi:LexA family transcriptional regulator [Roseinatronobacter sp.]|uniref:LexA family transcriptional regulator n=1 Tax=Roseinatronobacter sp. TaxID=1945755 RepID=UPI003F7056CB
MMVTFREALDTAISRTGRTPAEIARRAGITYDKLRNLRQGKSRTTNVDDAMRVAAAFGVSLEDFYNGNLTNSDLRIAVAGRVGAGASVELVDAYAKGEGLYHVACPPQISPTGVVAVEVVGDSMEPVYSEGDVLFYTRNSHEGLPAEDVGKKCIVADMDGRVWVKQVQRGTAAGLFNLVSINPGAQTVWDVAIQWAARVRFHMPADLIRKL